MSLRAKRSNLGQSPHRRESSVWFAPLARLAIRVKQVASPKTPLHRHGQAQSLFNNPTPTEAGHRANLGRDSTTRRLDLRNRNRNRNHLRLERSHPTANCPIGRARSFGANRAHTRHAPARRAAQRQAQSKQDWAREEPPAPMPPRRGRPLTPGSIRALLSPEENLRGNVPLWRLTNPEARPDRRYVRVARLLP
jgi:hypothetical protein